MAAALPFHVLWRQRGQLLKVLLNGVGRASHLLHGVTAIRYTSRVWVKYIRPVWPKMNISQWQVFNPPRLVDHVHQATVSLLPLSRTLCLYVFASSCSLLLVDSPALSTINENYGKNSRQFSTFWECIFLHGDQL